MSAGGIACNSSSSSRSRGCRDPSRTCGMSLSSLSSRACLARTERYRSLLPPQSCKAYSRRERKCLRQLKCYASGKSDKGSNEGKPMPGNVPMPAQPALLQSAAEPSAIQKFINPGADELPDELSMPIWDHLEELRERVLISALAAGLAILTCFCFSKDLVVFLEAPVITQGVKFLALSPGEFFFTTLKVSGYAGLLVATPTILYEIISYVIPGLTKNERKFLAPIVFGSSVLFYLGLLFSYEILTPAALTFFVSYADGAVESFWSIDQYFEFVLVLMLSTGLAFQVPVVQVMLGQLRIVTAQQMFAIWRWVVVGSTVAAAVLTPSTDPFTQALLAIPLVGLYMGGAAMVAAIEKGRTEAA